MKPILAGIETEYGLYVEGRGAENQVEDSKALVRSYPGKRFSGWDYRYESSRADLRGFRLDRLAVDPNDARFDAGKTYGSDAETRADQILPNGARLYNDHGHPEYSTPECWTLDELVRQDLAGERAVLLAAEAFQRETGLETRIYKNNTDFHGASYGTHESYLVYRRFGFEELYRAVTPILIARQVLCGAGKVGSETGEACDFQVSQRADFFSEAASAETLYRRPVFNTRDEPHADPATWVRLHVICGDANRIPSATRRKIGLVKLALALLEADAVPEWRIPHPVKAFQSISRQNGDIELDRRSWTNPREILESYFAAAETVLGVRAGMPAEGPPGEFGELIHECRDLFEAQSECPDRFRAKVDWAAKRWLLEQVREQNGWDWREAALRSYDLEYHRVDPAESLFDALAEAGEVEGAQVDHTALDGPRDATRALARGLAIDRWGQHLANVCWRSLKFRLGDQVEEVELLPDREYPESLREAASVEEFIALLRNPK